MFMIKSNGGSGSVKSCTFSNFIGHKNAYSLNINAHWTQLKLQSGDGVLYQDLNFTNWKGSCVDGAKRAPVSVICPDAVPCHGINIEDFAIWTESGNRQYYKCSSAFGNGFCLRPGSAYSAFSSTITVAAAPYVLTPAAPLPPPPHFFFLLSCVALFSRRGVECRC